MTREKDEERVRIRGSAHGIVIPKLACILDNSVPLRGVDRGLLDDRLQEDEMGPVIPDGGLRRCRHLQMERICAGVVAIGKWKVDGERVVTDGGKLQKQPNLAEKRAKCG